MGGSTVAASGLTAVALGESARQAVLFDVSGMLENLDHSQRHLGVIGVVPRRRRQRSHRPSELQDLGRTKEALAKGIADRQSHKGQEGALHPFRVIGSHRFHPLTPGQPKSGGNLCGDFRSVLLRRQFVHSPRRAWGLATWVHGGRFQRTHSIVTLLRHVFEQQRTHRSEYIQKSMPPSSDEG